MNNKITKPVFTGNERDLPNWAVNTALPWLVTNLRLTAGVLCGSIPEHIRREVYGLGPDDALPTPIDWSRNSIVISPPGTGKGMAIFVDALTHFRKIFVVVPAVIQAHKMEQSIDALYHHGLGGCATAQKKSAGIIEAVTVGILHQRLRDPHDEIWDDDVLLVVDEAQRILDEDLLTQFMVAAAARRGKRVCIVSATIAQGNLPTVFGHGPGQEAVVYNLNKKMFPVDIQLRSGDDMSDLLNECYELKTGGTTMLLFAPSRSRIMSIVKQLRNMGDHIWPVAVTGAHIVEEQLELIRRGQELGKTVVVVGTPGTLDSSVTIPGLTTGGIIDERISVRWNQYGMRERVREMLPINHIIQMILRWGRIARIDGGMDRVYIFSSADRKDVLVENPAFTPITGGGPWQPLESVVLEAVGMNISFADIHEYMVCDFADQRIRAAYQRLVTDGVIEHYDDTDGYRLTNKGRTVLALPYEYEWSLVIANSSGKYHRYLCIAASFGRLADLDMFELDERDEVAGDPMSDVLRKIRLGIEYINAHNDDHQRYMTDTMDLSFRRMEQMEQLFYLGCDALGLRVDGLRRLEDRFAEKLLVEIVQRGLDSRLFQVFFLGKRPQGWSDLRRTPGTAGGYRRFVVDSGSLRFAENSVAGTTVIVGVPQWFTSTGQQLMGNIDDVSIVPMEMCSAVIMRYASQNNNWMPMKFEVAGDRGKSELAYMRDGVKYIPSRMDNQPVEGVWYWCEEMDNLRKGVYTVMVHVALPVITSELCQSFPELISETIGKPEWDITLGRVRQYRSWSVRSTSISQEVVVCDREVMMPVFVAALMSRQQTAEFPIWQSLHDENMRILAEYTTLVVRSGGTLQGYTEDQLCEQYRVALAGKTLDLGQLSNDHDFMDAAQLSMNTMVTPGQLQGIFVGNPDIISVAGYDRPVVYSRDRDGVFSASISLPESCIDDIEGEQVLLPNGREVVITITCSSIAGTLSQVRVQLEQKFRNEFESQLRQSVAIPNEEPFQYQGSSTGFYAMYEESFSTAIGYVMERLTRQNAVQLLTDFSYLMNRGIQEIYRDLYTPRKERLKALQIEWEQVQSGWDANHVSAEKSSLDTRIAELARLVGTGEFVAFETAWATEHLSSAEIDRLNTERGNLQTQARTGMEGASEGLYNLDYRYGEFATAAESYSLRACTLRSQLLAADAAKNYAEVLRLVEFADTLIVEARAALAVIAAEWTAMCEQAQNVLAVLRDIYHDRGKYAGIPSSKDVDEADTCIVQLEYAIGWDCADNRNAITELTARAQTLIADLDAYIERPTQQTDGSQVVKAKVIAKMQGGDGNEGGELNTEELFKSEFFRS